MAEEKKAAPVPAEEAPAADIYGLKARFGDAIGAITAPRGDLTVEVAREQLLAVCRFFKEEQGFDYLILVTGVDREDHLESVIHLGKMDAPTIVVLRTALSYTDARVPSVTSLWQGANWHERESFDLMGIQYEGHPDLRRILLSDDWDEYPYPLRKKLKLHSFTGKVELR